MNKIYVVVDDNKIPIIAYSDYDDARETVANMFGKSLAQLNKHCFSIPFCESIKYIDFNDSKHVIALTIQATLSAYDQISTKFEKILDENS